MVVVVHAFLRIHEDYLQTLYGVQFRVSPSSHEHNFRVHFPGTHHDVAGVSFGAPLMGE